MLDQIYPATSEATVGGLVDFGLPGEGLVTDMEEMDLQSKLAFLKTHKLWKCMNKNEVLDEHAATWEVNGLSKLTYSILTDTKIPGTRSESRSEARKVVVDVMENDHWSDLVCSDSHTQLEKDVHELKREFSDRVASKSSSKLSTSKR